MKKILFILFVLISKLSSSQTRLDSLIFDRINEYRELNCLNRIIWDTTTYKVGDNQTEYMYLTNFIEHIQEKPNDTTILGNFIIEPSIVKRFTKYVECKYQTNYYGENLIRVKLDSIYNEDDIVTEIISSWISSKEHNELLLDKDMIYGSINHKIKNNVIDILEDIENDGIYIEIKSDNLYVAFETIN